MKKIIYSFVVLSLCALSNSLFAQDHWCWTCNPATYGYVRIGVNAPFTTKQLYVQANSTDAIAAFDNINQFGNGVMITAAEDPLRVSGFNNYSGNYLIVKKNPSIPTSANVGINKSNPSTLFSLDIAGSVQSYGYFTSSDIRSKKNISSDIAKYLDLYKIKTYTYSYKDDPSNRSHFGLMAQEVLNTYPNLVAGNEQEGYSVNYIEMIPLLIRGLQDQKQTIDMLTEEVNSLKKNLVSLRKENSIVLEEQKMIIYPNPSSSSVKVTFNTSFDGNASHIEVVNLNGEIIRTIERAGKDTIEITSENFQKGVYFVRYISNGELKETKRLLIEK
ncbi:T9SS type A sorting domain-containing protein [Roseivirga thermotolerans]|uniref:Peptidase S74 domain-containing protein n=1 Tax=Roseivirga thermotolerans TaxID=1758176 RepID=A0ABQ3I5V5_9BACT|nr:T9SS type A sorting domain-containing protein [Roseivirga thermotolerans]GHE53356.1 hypothetical protein GCM10011340_04840 [Roseivirga thermotolerans]